MKNLKIKAFGGLLFLFVALAAMLFILAWTFNYWQAWVFLAVFYVSILALTVYVARNDPKMLEQRITVHPADEKEKGQKIVSSFAPIGILIIFIFPVLDHRFGWSAVPPYASIIGDILVALGLYMVYLVFKENTFAAPAVKVVAEQKVISTGPYAIVRHPMYSSALVWFIGVPLALGSAWGVLIVIPIALVLTWRLLGEEKLLSKNLPGYAEYQNKVKYHLIPFVW